MKKTINGLFVFGKAQLSAFIGGVVDYGLMITLTEIFRIHYTISIALSGIAGAIVNFSLNRIWTFRSKVHHYNSSITRQLSKFFLVVLNSIMMKASGTFLITTFFRIDYKFSRIMTDLLVSLIFNYNLQKHWVFKKKKVDPDLTGKS